ncbi:MAG: glycosyltransferase family 4 protein [Deltaproteobacteria bacterium]|nr:glycosyltransferase family 4 protein [Deltaproteobacteria bacterium]
MKIAFIHDWLVTYAGAERVLEQMLACFPEADLFSVVDFIPKGKRDFLLNKKSQTTFIQKLPWAKKKYRQYLPLMTLAIEQLDLRGYDLVISSSHAVAKGVLTGPDQLHLSMIYSPMRYAWDLQEKYLEEIGAKRGFKSQILRYLLHRLRRWDLRSAMGVDDMIAISHYIARRIYKVYRRESTVIYPPVALEAFTLKENKEDFYITASRMVPYKKIDLIVEAFQKLPNLNLIVIGEGPDFAKIKALAGPNVRLMGFQPQKVLLDHLQRAKAFIFASEEDFGIAPLEAQACGTPVIAYGKGGALETIRPVTMAKATGLFFEEQTSGSLVEAINKFESGEFSFLPQDCRQNALRFGEERFRQEFYQYVMTKWNNFQKRKSVLPDLESNITGEA